MLGLVAGLLAVAAACAPRMPAAPTVVTPRFPEYVFPDVPATLQGSDAAPWHERAWLLLQAGDLRTAERTFSTALDRAPGFFPAETGMGYVSLASQDFGTALQWFDTALARANGYESAMAGRGEALLGLNREAEALETFEALLASHPSLAPVRRRVDVLRFRQLQESVEAARRAAEAGRDAEALAAYRRALAASPESPFLYRELAVVEQRTGDVQQALSHARRAVELDPSDVRSFELIGDINLSRGMYDAAVDAYSRATALDGSATLAEKLERAREAAEYERLPAEYREIPSAARLTRGGLAALIGVRLRGLLDAAPAGAAALMTDTRSHWAAPWILAVTRSGVMAPFPNHTFQPELPIRRADLAQVVSRVLTLISRASPGLESGWASARVRFRDLPVGHLSYPAASRAVASGVMPMLDNDTFQLTRIVPGSEAVAAVERLEELAERALGSRRPVARALPDGQAGALRSAWALFRKGASTVRRALGPARPDDPTP